MVPQSCELGRDRFTAEFGFELEFLKKFGPNFTMKLSHMCVVVSLSLHKLIARIIPFIETDVIVISVPRLLFLAYVALLCGGRQLA